MNSQAFTETLVENLHSDVPQIPKKDLASKIAAKLSEMKEKGSYAELDEEQQRLLAAYDIWRKSSDAVTGVFHYKKSR